MRLAVLWRHVGLLLCVAPVVGNAQRLNEGSEMRLEVTGRSARVVGGLVRLDADSLELQVRYDEGRRPILEDLFFVGVNRRLFGPTSNRVRAGQHLVIARDSVVRASERVGSVALLFGLYTGVMAPARWLVRCAL